MVSLVLNRTQSSSVGKHGVLRWWTIWSYRVAVFTKLGLVSTGLDCGLEMVIACISKYSRGTPARLPRLSDHIARRRRLARGHQADRCACPGKAVLMRLADAGLSMKAILSTATDSGDGFRG